MIDDDKVFRVVLAIQAVLVAVILAGLGGLAFVAVHFLSKAW